MILVIFRNGEELTIKNGKGWRKADDTFLVQTEKWQIALPVDAVSCIGMYDPNTGEFI